MSRSVVIEWPPQFSLDPFDGMGDWWWRGFRNVEATWRSKLVVLEERQLVGRRVLAAAPLAAASVAASLLGRRTIVGDEELLLREVYSAIALERLGQVPATRAVLIGREYGRTDARTPLLQAEAWTRIIWDDRLPAILLDIEHRVGATAFAAGVEEFLRAADQGPGSSRELLERVGRRGGVSLEGVYRDVFVAASLPELELVDVSFRRVQSDWEVTGAVHNRGTGEAFCPVILRTELDPVSTSLSVAAAATVPFRLRTSYRPRTLLLDPDSLCFRYRPNPGVAARRERVDYREGS